MNTHPPGLPNQWIPISGVVQMQYAVKTDVQSLVGTTITALTGLSLSFRPKFGDSKIILASQVCGSAITDYSLIRIVRSLDDGATWNMISRPDAPSNRREAGGGYVGEWDSGVAFSSDVQFAVDADHAGRSIQYRVEAWTRTGGATFTVNRTTTSTNSSTHAAGVSYLIAIEIRNPV